MREPGAPSCRVQASSCFNPTNLLQMLTVSDSSQFVLQVYSGITAPEIIAVAAAVAGKEVVLAAVLLVVPTS